ncbi:MAG: hypothetical protein KJ697_01695 [Nanoarchaeota archaeon]|nr:hypothetical protein [Nanoarchaeota archaeon]MBU4124260.1 hypothetical protein [Nanoarchaeota archaeon]
MAKNEMYMVLAIIGIFLVVVSLPAIQNSVAAGNAMAVFSPTAIIGLLLIIGAIALNR